MKHATKQVPIVLADDDTEHATAELAVAHEVERRLDAWGINSGGKWDSRMIASTLVEYADPLVKTLLPICKSAEAVALTATLQGIVLQDIVTNDPTLLRVEGALIAMANGDGVVDRGGMTWVKTPSNSIVGRRQVEIDPYNPEIVAWATAYHPTQRDWAEAHAGQSFKQVPNPKFALTMRQALHEMQAGWFVRTGPISCNIRIEGSVTVTEKREGKESHRSTLSLEDWQRRFATSTFERTYHSNNPPEEV